MVSLSSIEIIPLLPEHRQSVINLLMSSFFLQEPLNEMLQFDIPHEPLSWVDCTIDGALHDQCSFIAIDTTSPCKDIVGVILNGISDRNHEAPNMEFPSAKLQFIFSLIDQVSEGYDLFKLYNTNLLFHCDIINVDEKARGLNLSSRLITKSLEKAQELGAKGASVVCSSLFSRKAFIQHGFQVINELLYSEHEDSRLKNMGMHDRCTLLARSL
ncbi:unnamed protein product [Rotaria magnacalcarata]|nr:unnamed protein product [Rotaria magnacalcarata]CAF4402941.1 unnamed protein product [Rotaria magnacalcarata]